MAQQRPREYYSGENVASPPPAKASETGRQGERVTGRQNVVNGGTWRQRALSFRTPRNLSLPTRTTSRQASRSGLRFTAMDAIGYPPNRRGRGVWSRQTLLKGRVGVEHAFLSRDSTEEYQTSHGSRQRACQKESMCRYCLSVTPGSIYVRNRYYSRTWRGGDKTVSVGP